VACTSSWGVNGEFVACIHSVKMVDSQALVTVHFSNGYFILNIFKTIKAHLVFTFLNNYFIKIILFKCTFRCHSKRDSRSDVGVCFFSITHFKWSCLDSHSVTYCMLMEWMGPSKSHIGIKVIGTLHHDEKKKSIDLMQWTRWNFVSCDCFAIDPS
jgi:hypothetical protein